MTKNEGDFKNAEQFKDASEKTLKRAAVQAVHDTA